MLILACNLTMPCNLDLQFQRSLQSHRIGLHDYMLAWEPLHWAKLHLDRRTRDEEPLVKLAFNWCRSEVLVRLHPHGARFDAIRRIWDGQIGPRSRKSEQFYEMSKNQGQLTGRYRLVESCR